MIKKILSILTCISLLLTLSSCGITKVKSKTRYEAEFILLFDTITRIVAYTDDKESFTEMSQLVYDTLKRYNNLFDIYNNYEGINNIKTLNDKASEKPIVVDKEIIELIKYSKDINNQYGDEFNIALGSVLVIWHDYRTQGIANPNDAKLPPLSLLEEANKHTNIEDVILDEENSTVFFKDKDLKLDVGSIAKGYATEKVAQLLKEKGYNNVLLSVGGNVRALSGKPYGENTAWNVGVQNPDNSDEMIVKTNLIDKSLVTSGDYQRYYYVGETKYHHIIDPKTLMPNNYYKSVSILCEDSGFADAMSTTIFNMTLDDGKALIESLPDVEAMWVLPNNEIVYSSSFQTYISS